MTAADPLAFIHALIDVITFAQRIEGGEWWTSALTWSGEPAGQDIRLPSAPGGWPRALHQPAGF